MGFSLRNLLNEAIAQVNPWDNGQTAHTVAQQRPVFTPSRPMPINRGPAPTPMPQQQQPQQDDTRMVLSRIYDQINPFDAGRTFKQATPTRQNDSVIHQFTHNGITNAGGDIVKSVTNIGAAPVELGRSILAEVTHNPAAELAAANRAEQDARNNLVYGLGQQFAGTGQALYDVAKEAPAIVTGNQIAEDHANAAAVRDFNKTPFGQVFDPLQHKLAEAQVYRDNPGLTKQQHDQVVARNEAEVGLDPTSSAGKQLLTSGLAGLQLVTADKVVNGVPIKEDLANKAATAQENVPKIIQAAQDSKVPQIISHAKEAVAGTANDILTGKPNRNISDAELASAQKVRNSMQGYGSSMDLTEQDMANYRNIQRKLGVGMNDHSAVDDVIGARRTYDTKQGQKVSVLSDQSGGAKAGDIFPDKAFPKEDGKDWSAGLSKAEQRAIPKVNDQFKVGDTVKESMNGKSGIIRQIHPNGVVEVGYGDKEAGMFKPSEALTYLTKDNAPEGSYAWLKQQEAEAAAKKAANEEPQPTVDQAQAAADKVKQQAAANKNPQTGRVDKQLDHIEKARQSVIDTAAREMRDQQQPGRNVRQEVLQHGGISSSDYESLPKGVIRKAGMSADKMAQELGFKSEDDLIEALQKPAPKPLTLASARTIVAQQLENGSHPYSADYKEIVDALKQRQDELSRYPNGKYRQVKVTDKPAPMTDEELASLSNTPEGKVNPQGKKIVKPDAKKEIRNADAERQVLADLKGNKGTDTAIENYIEATGVTLQKAVKDINRVAREAGLHTDLGKNPIEGRVLLPKVDEGNWHQATLNSRYVQSKELELGGKALDSYKALSAHDQVLLKEIETGTVRQVAKKANDPAAFKQAEKDIRNYYDHRHAYDRALGIDVGYRTNYLRQLFDRVEKKPEEGEVAPTGDEQFKATGGNKNPGYTKERSFDTLGVDVGKALEKDIKSSSFNHAKLTYEKGLNEAFPDKIANGEIVHSKNDGTYIQIRHPFGKDLSAPEDIAHEINSRVWHKNDSKTLDVYDKLNHGFKYVKLSGGLFHAFTESGNFVGQQLASGKLFTDPAATGRMAKVFFSQKAMNSELARMSDEGVLDKARLSGLTTTPREILADANVSALDKAKNATHALAKYTGIKSMHDATFQREIPYAKLKIFEQKTAGLDPMKPADLAKMRNEAEAINNLFGGINREVHGMKPSSFKWVQRALLATDFTEGKWVTLAKALSDKGEAGTLAREAVLGKALLFGLIATAGQAIGGNYQGKGKWQIARDAAGNLLDPTFEIGGYKVGLPKTHISEAVGVVKPTQKNGKAWNASGTLTYLQDRAAALPSEAIQLLSNKNYYGQPLYGTNTKKNGGGKISGPQAAFNIANTALPIPVGQAATTAQGKQNVAAAAANVVGFKAKPNSDNTVSFQGQETQLSDKQTESYQNQLNSTMKSMQQQLTGSSAYKNANPNDQAKMLSDLKKNVNSAVQRDFASKNSLGQFANDFTGKGSQASTKEQDILSGKINPDAYVPNSGNSDSYAVDQFKKSDKQVTTIGNDTYYKTGDGTVKHQNTFDYNMGIQTSKVDFALDRFKAIDNYSAWQQSAQQKYDLLQQQIDHLNPQSQQEDITKLKKAQADLVDQAQKYASYGGFTKPKSGSSKVRSLKNSYTPFSMNSTKSSNDSLKSILASARIASPGSGRRIKAKQVVKVA